LWDKKVRITLKFKSVVKKLLKFRKSNENFEKPTILADNFAFYDYFSSKLLKKIDYAQFSNEKKVK